MTGRGPHSPGRASTPGRAHQPRPPGPPMDRRTVMQDGRAKAYRPLPPAAIGEALRAGLAAYERGDFFEAHDLLEPAWMGTPDPVERDIYQGLIKLAAGGVHRVRGNREGTTKNLRGARDRLGRAGAAGEPPCVADLGLDLAAILAAVERVLDELEGDTPLAGIELPPLVRRTR